MKGPHGFVFLVRMCRAVLFFVGFLAYLVFFRLFCIIVMKTDVKTNHHAPRVLLLLLLLLMSAVEVSAQRADFSKLSPRLRMMVVGESAPRLKVRARNTVRERHVCAFIQLSPSLPRRISYL